MVSLGSVAVSPVSPGGVLVLVIAVVAAVDQSEVSTVSANHSSPVVAAVGGGDVARGVGRRRVAPPRGGRRGHGAVPVRGGGGAVAGADQPEMSTRRSRDPVSTNHSSPGVPLGCGGHGGLAGVAGVPAHAEPGPGARPA